MLEALILVFIVLFFFHYIYENFVASYFYEKFLYELFALRDELFLMRLDNEKKEDARSISTAIDSISGIIYILKDITLVNLLRYNHNDEYAHLVKKDAERNLRIILNSHIEKVKVIHEQSMKIALRALAINSGGLLIYLIPIVIGALLYKRVEHAVNSVAIIGEGRLKKTNTFGNLAQTQELATATV